MSDGKTGEPHGMGHLYRLCYERMRGATGRDRSLLKITRYLAKMPQRLVSLTAWLMEGAPAASPACTALRKYCCYDQRKRLNLPPEAKGFMLNLTLMPARTAAPGESQPF